MKIELEGPFKQKWSKGYLVTNSENRKNIILYNSKKDRTTISYARYLISIEENRFLEDYEEVDHIDNNKTNDNINNLQILTKKKHNDKHKRKSQMALIKCPMCKKEFKRRKGNSQAIPAKKGQLTFCKKKCRNNFLSTFPHLPIEERRALSEKSLIGIIIQ